METLDIVTLSWKREEALNKCIRAVLENTSDRLNNIYVIINECDRDYSYLHRLSDKIQLIVFPENRGVVARNEAMKLSKADYIGQVDDDVVVHAAWDEKAFGLMEEGVKAVGDDGSWVIPDLSNYCLPDKKPGHGDYCDVLAGYCWIYKNEGFLYDEEFGMHWHEETDLQFQMREAGYRFRRYSGMCRHEHRGKPNSWMEYHDVNIKRVQDKWGPKKDKLRLEKVW